MRDALRPGGLWLFAGPLEYHTWPGLCPTLSQLVELAAEEGSPSLASNPAPAPDPNPNLPLPCSLYPNPKTLTRLEPLAEPQLVAAPYLGKPDSLLHKQQWQAALFACRKV